MLFSAIITNNEKKGSSLSGFTDNNARKGFTYIKLKGKSGKGLPLFVFMVIEQYSYLRSGVGGRRSENNSEFGIRNSEGGDRKSEGGSWRSENGMGKR